MSDPFAHSRSQPWRGWRHIRLPDAPRVRVLDAGCGNGRLFVHLTRHSEVPIDYVGIDFSPELLRYAETTVAHNKRRTDSTQLMVQDLTAFECQSLAASEGPFDRVFLFGVLHHIAEAHRRESLLTRLAQTLSCSGELWVTIWQFTDDPRFKRHVVDSPENTPSPLEPGAAWLNFSGHGHRYCVQPSVHEINNYEERCGLKEVKRYRDDGKSGQLNMYIVYTAKT